MTEFNPLCFPRPSGASLNCHPTTTPYVTVLSTVSTFDSCSYRVLLLRIRLQDVQLAVQHVLICME